MSRKMLKQRNWLLIKRWLPLFAVFISFNLQGQFADSEKTMRSIREGVGKFLIKQKELNRDQIDIEKQFTIFEIVKNEPLGFSETGIFGFRTVNAPNTTYILLKDGPSYKIIDVYDISEAVKTAIKFLKRHRLPNGEVASYIEEIIEIYKNNRYDSKIKL